MGYAIVGYFDSITDKKIKTLWKGLADISVDDYLINSDNDPHIKFAMVDSIDLEIIQSKLYILSEKIKKINIHFKKYGFYPNEKPFITIDIADNIEIIQLHSEIQMILKEFGLKDTQGYFTSGIWKPDCQLTISFDKTKLAIAVNYLVETTLPFNGQLEKIGVIKYHPAEQLFSFPLTKHY